MKRYEAMFLFDNTAAYEWPTVEQEVNRLIGRIGAQLLACVKFDERKLAFEIRGRKRGTYVLTYMEAPPDRIGEFERDAHLSESVLRVLVLRADSLTPERLAELKAWPADKPLQPLAADSRRDGGDRYLIVNGNEDEP
ncbi:MAG TPA: 30S ribosomal protein S6, partial [Phycisphaerae bacterium]|nr:30S ribosomal protein S6 [Phycisphaerae bacterium]